jgi:hypothetical protein
VRRPGGAALNAGQVGGLRAASYIAGFYLKNDPWFGGQAEILQKAADELAAFERELRIAIRAPAIRAPGGEPGGGKGGAEKPANNENPPIAEKLRRLQEINSRAAGFLRNKGETERILALIEALDRESLEAAEDELDVALKYREILLLSRLLHQGIWRYLDSGGLSRGSFAVINNTPADNTATSGNNNPIGDAANDAAALQSQAEQGFSVDTAFQDQVLITFYEAGTNSVRSSFRPVRPIPQTDLWFEKVWADYRAGAVFRG